ncbi:hypothetical protein K493DRAFT_404652 [Basidiobolus meristosporus CBS 931.73]|uniref:Carbohydrate-binding module family 19 domain-containing protein n=1 Tax=Basidiobolus meristosporus CBS 931.73 TaxID=1314790 RepID=A0A1Y1Z2R4_9FUNG|nr:hypothetical protein K493DRAFT_404652 [Basidiobolus meristosporus CBS 931.73]|eukprot:ORY04489.1 hypothetical protein K493DRAFT_404652 [Basidiobolus meristosporus CBS 931.73]
MQYCPSFGEPTIETCSGNQICKENLGCILPGSEGNYKPLSGPCPKEFEFSCSGRDALALCINGQWQTTMCPTGTICKEKQGCVEMKVENPIVNSPSVEPASSTLDIVESVVLQTKVVTHMVAETTAVVTVSKKNNCPAEYQCVDPGQSRQFKKCINGEMVQFNCQGTAICIDWYNKYTFFYLDGKRRSTWHIYFT